MYLKTQFNKLKKNIDATVQNQMIRREGAGGYFE
jgi:hypothetical protein